MNRCSLGQLGSFRLRPGIMATWVTSAYDGSMSPVPTTPQLFISHKHADKEIADVVREFVYARTNREITVYQSSSPDAKRPEMGRVLSDQLKRALWETSVVML